MVLDLIVVLGRTGNRLLEDGRIAGEAPDAVGDECVEFAVLQHVAADEVEPNGLSGFVQIVQLAHGQRFLSRSSSSVERGEYEL